MVEKNGKTNGVMGAALFGAAVGAAAMALLNKSTRANIKKTLVDALEAGDHKLDEVSSQAARLKKDVMKKAEKGLDKAKRKFEQTA